MYRRSSGFVLAAGLLVCSLAWAACSSADGKTRQAAADASAVPSASVVVAPVPAVEQPIARFIRATGSLMPDDQADVAAETGGRIVATPVERGTLVAQGAVLARIASSESEARVREAEANARQIEARLGLTSRAVFDAAAVPEVQTARASFELAQSEFDRIKSLLDERVVSQSEFDQRRTQVEAARQQYEAAKNTAVQQYQALQAARARVTLAQKALDDTVVRAPFTGVVGERLVSVGDFVSPGTKVAVVVRVDPLRVQLTVPEQFISAVAVGQTVVFEVDAFKGRRFEGQVRYVSPALEASQRALIVEAVVANRDRELKPGLFATAHIEQPDRTPAVLVPASAVHAAGGTSRVFVVNGGSLEERVVTTGQAVGALVELTTGVKAGELVASNNVAQLTDGARISE